VVEIWRLVGCEDFVSEFVLPNTEPRLKKWKLLALQPHARGLQLATSGQTVPREVVSGSDLWSVYFAVGAVPVPEPSAVTLGTVGRVQVVLTVVRGEHHAVLDGQCIVAGVTRVPGHVQPVVVRLWPYFKCPVLGVVPVAAATRLQVELQLVAATQRQPTVQFVAEPVVASRVIETDFELRPRTVEEVGPVDVLLDQQRHAVGCRTFVIISMLLGRRQHTLNIPYRALSYLLQEGQHPLTGQRAVNFRLLANQ